MMGVVPYLAGDAVKLIIALLLGKRIAPPRTSSADSRISGKTGIDGKHHAIVLFIPASSLANANLAGA